MEALYIKHMLEEMAGRMKLEIVKLLEQKVSQNRLKLLKLDWKVKLQKTMILHIEFILKIKVG